MYFHGGLNKRIFNVTRHCFYYLNFVRGILAWTGSGIHQRCFMKKNVLRNFTKFTRTLLFQGPFFNQVVGLRPATLLKRDSGTCVFCEFCEISEENLFTEHLSTTASKQVKWFTKILAADKIFYILKKAMFRLKTLLLFLKILTLFIPQRKFI